MPEFQSYFLMKILSRDQVMQLVARNVWRLRANYTSLEAVKWYSAQSFENQTIKFLCGMEKDNKRIIKFYNYRVYLR